LIYPNPTVASGPYDLVAIASSLGGLAALSLLLSELPAELPVSIVIVQHVERSRKSALPEILERRTNFNVMEASDGRRLENGNVYVAPPDYHLLINPDSSMSLTQSELVNFVRPSADLLFQSVADSFKERAIAIVLTGSGHDGTQGIKAIKSCGGIVIAQDESSSKNFGMPHSAIETGDVDYILPLNEIAGVLVDLIGLKV